MDNIYDTEHMSDEAAEAKAYSLGWRNQEEFNGDPEKWTDAKTFLNKANDNIPMMRENFRKIEAQNRKLQEQLNEMTQKQAEFLKRQEEAEEKGYKRALADIEAKQREAVEAGNLEQFDILQKRKAELSGNYLKERETEKPRQSEVGIPVADQIAITSFEQQNRWFREDPELNADMRGFVLSLKSRYPELSMIEILEKAKERTVKANPDKFSTKATEVLSGNQAPGVKKVSFASLPAEDRAAFEREWDYTEREMRIKGFSADKIKAQKEQYQKDCLSLYK